MENKLGMVGKGVVKNGIMTFVDASGKGFAKHVSKPVTTPVVRREPAIKNEVITVEEVIDVPSFMKSRKPVVVAEPVNKVVHINNGYQGETKQTLRSALKKLNNWLWDLEG